MKYRPYCYLFCQLYRGLIFEPVLEALPAAGALTLENVLAVGLQFGAALGQAIVQHEKPLVALADGLDKGGAPFRV